MRLLREERGAALLVALGVFVIVSVLGITVLTTAGGSLNLTMHDRASNQAFHLAEAGFNRAVYQARANSITTGTVVLQFDHGEASVTVAGITSFLWNVKSVGIMPYQSGLTTRRAVEGKVLALNPYNMFFVSGGMSDQVEGNAQINGAFYVRDLLELSGSGAGAGTISGGPLFIKDNPGTPTPTGDLQMSGNAQVGSPGSPIYAFIDGTYQSNGQLYTTAIYSDVPELTMPQITNADMGYYRDNVATLIIDNDTTVPPNGNRDLILDRNAADQTYGNWPTDNYLRWDISADRRTATLYIDGTVFVDGKLKLGDNNMTRIDFAGRGTIYANGEIAIDTELVPDGGAATFPVTNRLGLVTPNEADLDPKAGDTIYAVIYAREEIEYDKAMTFYGTGLTNKMDFNANPTLNIVAGLAGNMPPGMPEIQTQTAITDWREVKP